MKLNREDLMLMLATSIAIVVATEMHQDNIVRIQRYHHIVHVVLCQFVNGREDVAATEKKPVDLSGMSAGSCGCIL